MNDPMVTQQRRALEPVQADQEEGRPEQWAWWLVVFLRVMAGLSMIKGLYHWAVVCGINAPTSVGFDGYETPYQSATVFFAVIDLVAAVGLWLAAPWGAVVWLTSLISMVAVELLFPRIFGGDLWVVVVELLLLAVYLLLALVTARAQPP